LTAEGTLAQRLSALASSDIADAQDGRGVLGSGLVRLSGEGTVSGRAITAACEDGSAGAALFAMADSQPGDVLCIAAPGPTAYIGDLVMSEVRSRGLTAVVLDGYLRDVDALPGMGFSCWARGATPVATGTRAPGQPMVPVEMGPTTVQPGDWIIADGDGAMAIPSGEVEAVVLRAEGKVAFEVRVRELMAGGATLIEAFTFAQH
jgi:4-hydroxy-4-methyl-2-oxoglutarate aldolase